MGRLNTLTVQKAAKPGLFSDGNGLCLQISKSGSKSWIFRFMLNTKPRLMGLGSVELVTLAEARLKALECRKLLLDGIDPIETRKTGKQMKALESAKTITFDECAAIYIETHRAGWKNIKHVSQWTNTIKTYVSPIIGSLPIQNVDTTLVMKIIEPLWFTRTETASRVRNRIELIISWATVRGYRKGDNPARWNGHLDQLLPKRSAVQQVEHFAALPVSEIGAFMKNLRILTGTVPLALEFQILTATRTGEAMGARWSEINLNEKIWTIPAARMKAKKEHRIPLSPRALEILKLAITHSGDDIVFPGKSVGKTLSCNAFLSLLKKRMNLDVTAHGFRSTFRDWAGERTNFPREVVEKALAHSLKDATEAAYQRGDLLMRRKLLMFEWEKFCTNGGGNSALVVDMHTSQRHQKLVDERSSSANDDQLESKI